MLKLFLFVCVSLIGLECSPKYNNLSTSIPGQYLIVVDKSATQENLNKQFSKYEVTELKKISEYVYSVKLRKDPGLNVIKKDIAKNKSIQSIETNKKIKLIKPVSGKVTKLDTLK